MKKALGILAGAVVLLGTGCASRQQTYYHRPVPYPHPVIVPRPVVVTPAPVVTSPPTTVVVPAINENQAIQIARAEAARHGWRNVGISQTAYWTDRWHVDIYNQLHKHVEHYGWVEVAPTGHVIAFSRSPHHHAGSYRHRHARY
jgi:hypothetical protein